MRNGNRSVHGGAGWVLVVVAAAWTLGGSIGAAEEQDSGILRCWRVNDFLQKVRAERVEAMVIPGAGEVERKTGPADLATQEKWRWGQAMLFDLEGIWKRPKSASARDVEMVLDFRDWCLGAQGAGNLKLAIASEETAVELLFRGLASGTISPEEIQRLLARCSTNSPTAEYWRGVLALEGHPSAGVPRSDEDEPEYLKLAAILNDIWQRGFVGPIGETRPDKSGWWGGRVEDFFAPQLMIRVLSLSQKSVALEACLEIQRATGGIPTERGDFLRTADAHARNILSTRERLTSWMIGNTAWDFWNKAREASER